MVISPVEFHSKAESRCRTNESEPIIEYPPSPEPQCTEYLERDIEDLFKEPEYDIPPVELDIEEFKQTMKDVLIKNKVSFEEGDMSKAIVALSSKAASLPPPKLKDISRLRTVHYVYEVPDSHPILAGLDRRGIDDPCPYLFAIWTSGETTSPSEQPGKQTDMGSSCDCAPDGNIETISGTLLIPCRTANRGRFPLNGTYFQVNEVFADDESSQQPLVVPRAWLWNLPRRSLYCGAYAAAIFRGLSTEQVQSCFWRGFVCVRGFNRKTRTPTPLSERFHISTMAQGKRKFKLDDE